MKERISKKGKRVLAFVLVFAMVLGVAPFSIGNEVKAASEPTLKETVVFSDTFDNGTSWNTSAGNWRLGSTSHADLVGVRNGTAPLGYATSTRNLYNVELNDVHVGADVRVTKAECYGSNLQYHFIFARGNTFGTSSVAFGLKTTKNATKSSLVVGYYTGNDSINVWHETEAVYDINTTYTLDLYVVGSLVMAKCNDQTVYLEEQTGLSVKGYCGITDRRATSNSAGGTYGTDYTKAGCFDNFTVGTVEEIIADGFKVNGPVVITKDGTGVADITMVTNGVDGATIDDAVVKVDALKNKETNLYEGEYTVSTTIKGTEKTSIATRVFVVDDLSKTVTKMNDSRWTGASATAAPKFTVDANGKATLTPSGSASAGISTLNVGENNGAYGNFYAEYTMTMTDLAAEARGFVDSFLCMDSYGNPGSNAWGANLFFDNRASQAPNSTFWARLRMSDGSVNQEYSKTFADPDIEGGKPVKIGMLVYDNTITLMINGVEAATYTGTAAYNGWFGIAQSGTLGKTTIENFVYIPLEKKVVSVKFDAPEAVMQGQSVEVKATPTYNWPYGVGEETTQGVVIEGLDTSTDGEKTYKVSYSGVEKELKVTVTKKPDGFKVNGPVVVTRDGKGVADVTILAGTAELERKEDVAVTVAGLDNPIVGLHEGSYEVTADVYGTNRTATATRVFVVNNMSDAVTNMSDSRWTGATATDTPRFTVDETGKATLTPSGSSNAGVSTLNMGANNGAYGDFYVEYILTVKNLAAEARGFVDCFLCMDSYGNTLSNAWGANLFFDNRAIQAPNNTFWARLRMSDGSVNKTYSQTFADPDIEGGQPMKIGMLVQGNTITLFINGVEAATHTGTAAYKGWFGISQSGTAGNSTVENFIYVPLEEKVVQDIQFSYPKMVLPGANVEVSAIPIYNWPYGQGDVITEGVTVTGLDTSTMGEKTFQASYGGVEKTLTLLVSNTMFEERFDGTLSDLTNHGWGKVNNNSAALKDEQLHLSGNQEGLYVTALSGSEAWTDYTVKADVRIEKTNQTPNTALATISARTTGLDNGYEWSIAIDKSGAAYARLYDRGAAKFLGRVDYPVEIGETYNLKLTVVGNTIKGYINGEKILETTADTSATGTVGVRRLGYNVYYDNVIVTLPEEDVPVQDVTKQQIWFTDTFESESVMTDRGWDKDGTIQDGELVLNNKYPTAFLTQIPGSNAWTDYTAQAHVTVVDSDEISPVGNSVSALIVRSLSDATGYEFGVSIQVSNDKGGFRLYNRTTSELLASTTEVVAERGKTYQLTVVVEGNRIRCYVDGQMVFDVTDTKNSNPTGYVGLRTVGYSGAYDNIVVRKVTDADRKGIFSNATATSPVTGDYTMPMYIPVIAMVTALTVVVFITRRRFHTNK